MFTNDLEAKLGGKPAGTSVAHHIQPITWCGTNDLYNGVFITDADHNQFTTWWKPKIAFTPKANYDESGAACTDYLKSTLGTP
jgi:hypothetical protein